jgi:uncharacterized protein YcfJ
MGGGPVEEEDNDHMSTTASSLSPAEDSTRHERVSTFPKNNQSAAVPVNQFEQEHPVLSTMAAGGIVGGLVGSLLGMGSVFGTTTGAFIGASVASRDDAIGASARRSALTLKSNLKTGVNKAVDRLNQEQIGRDLTLKMSSALQALVDTSERYQVAQKVESAANTVYQTAEPRVRTLLEKVSEADTNEYLPKALGILRRVDSATGFSRSVDAVKRELKV